MSLAGVGAAPPVPGPPAVPVWPARPVAARPPSPVLSGAGGTTRKPAPHADTSSPSAATAKKTHTVWRPHDLITAAIIPRTPHQRKLVIQRRTQLLTGRA